MDKFNSLFPDVNGLDRSFRDPNLAESLINKLRFRDAEVIRDFCSNMKDYALRRELDRTEGYNIYLKW